jgi:hypothetical protein
VRSSTFSSRRIVGAVVLLGSIVGLDQSIYVARQGFFPPRDPFFDGPRQTARLLDEIEDEATCVFLGDSHIMCAVVPEIVEERLSKLWPERGVTGLNLLFEGRHPALGLSWLAEAGIQPAIVVIDISPMRFSAPIEDESLTRLFRAYGPGPVDFEAWRARIEHEASTFWMRLLPSTAHPLDPGRLGLALAALGAGHTDRFVEAFFGLPVTSRTAQRQGFSTIEEVTFAAGTEPERRRADLVSAARSISRERVHARTYLEHLVRAISPLAGGPTEIVLVRAPLSPPLRALDDAENRGFYDALRQVTAAVGIPFLEGPPEASGYDHVDGHHLRSGSAVLYTEYLSERLIEIVRTRRRGEAMRHNQRGQRWREIGKLDAAEAEFEAAIALAPDDPSPRANRGLLLLQRRRWDEALEAFEAALERAPSDGPRRRALESFRDEARRRIVPR